MENSGFNQIAKDYHLKRKKPWRPLVFFLDHLKNKAYTFKGISLDLGCANGRNFKLMSTPPNKLIGLDISLKLLTIAKNRNIGITELSKIRLIGENLENIKMSGYAYFNSYPDENERYGEKQYMLATIAPNINYFHSLKIKELFNWVSNEINSKKKINLKRVWKEISDILITNVV